MATETHQQGPGRSGSGTSEPSRHADRPGTRPDARGGDAAPRDPEVIDWRDERPTYLEPGFILGMLVVAVLAGVLIYMWGNSGNIAPEPTVAGAVTVPATAPTHSAGIGECPTPGSDVDIEAARTIRSFLALAVGQKIAGLQVGGDVQSKIDASAPLPPVARMTRMHGFNADGDTVSSCVQSYWYEGDQVHTSTDVVVVQRVDKGWQVSQWLRNNPSLLPRNDSVGLPFLQGSGSCGTPDRVASVQIPAGNPSDRLRAAVEELASGSAGRAQGATTALPPDLQVVSASVQGLSARVEVTPTTDKMTDCTGKAAINQIKAVATTIAQGALPPEQTTTTETGRKRSSSKSAGPAVDVQVVVNGQPVSSLRP